MDKNTTSRRFELFLYCLSLDLQVSVSFEDDQVCVIGSKTERDKLLARLQAYSPPMLQAFYTFNRNNQADTSTYVDVVLISEESENE